MPVFERKHLWVLSMNGDVKDSASYLTPDEVARSARFRFAQDRERYIFFRAGLRRILAKYCLLAPQDIAFSYNEFHKPFLKDSNIHFNFSHAEDFAICAIVAGGSVGVDVEEIKEIDVNAMAKIVFSEEEKRSVENLSDEKKRLAFYTIWTGKEAYGKALGCGIMYPLHQLTIPSSNSLYVEGKQWGIEYHIMRRDTKRYMISCVSDLEENETDFFKYE